MKIYILGAGALGSVFGCVLHLGGQDVTLLCRTEMQKDIINTKGLNMKIGEKTQIVRLRAATDKEELPPPDLMIVLVKSYATRPAIKTVLKIIGANTLVVSLQNGMGHEDTIAEFVPRHQILGGKTYVGGVKFLPNSIVAGYKDKLTILGAFEGQNTEGVLKIATIFNEAGLVTKVSDNIVATMWDKLFINVATGAVSAISGLCYGDLYQMEELEAVAIGAVNEALKIAKKLKIPISVKNGETAWQMASAGLPYDFKASMLQSLESGNRTEIDFINGYVVKKGLEVGIPTPLNQTLVACLKGIEKKKLG
jgi:2-dehydropantoate 2-reductase